jgi:DNA-binding NarL/FixJ family response regulator
MPGTDGIQATEEIVGAGQGSRVLILTTFDLDEYAFAGLRAGASGFVLKDVPPAELIGAIRAVAAGDAVVAPRVTRSLLDQLSAHLPDPRAEPPVIDTAAVAALTDREREVFGEVARARDHGLGERT